jgi:ubiquitin carboxyl-terminal hydrolase 7
MVNRQNKTVRPDQPVPDPDMTIEEVFHRYSGSKLAELRLWAEVAEEIDSNGDAIWPNTPVGSPPKTDNILLFLKWFDIENQVLRGAGHIYIGKERKVEELVPLILKIMRWPEKSSSGERTSLKLYEVSQQYFVRFPLMSDRKLNRRWLIR